MKHLYGYGIVDRYGTPWWDEACVCKDREPLLSIVRELNDPVYIEHADRTPYRVVRLYWESKARHK
jgi:hypothetical protein